MINKQMKIKTKEIYMITGGRRPEWNEVSEVIESFISNKVWPHEVHVEYQGSCGTADPMDFGTFIIIKYTEEL